MVKLKQFFIYILIVCHFGLLWYPVLSWLGTSSIFSYDTIDHANQFSGLLLCDRREVYQKLKLIWLADLESKK